MPINPDKLFHIRIPLFSCSFSCVLCVSWFGFLRARVDFWVSILKREPRNTLSTRKENEEGIFRSVLIRLIHLQKKVRADPSSSTKRSILHFFTGPSEKLSAKAHDAASNKRKRKLDY